MFKNKKLSFLVKLTLCYLVKLNLSEKNLLHI